MLCPQCRYVMDDFDKECPRCHGEGLAPSPVAPPMAPTTPAQSTPTVPLPTMPIAPPSATESIATFIGKQSPIIIVLVITICAALLMARTANIANDDEDRRATNADIEEAMAADKSSPVVRQPSPTPPVSPSPRVTPSPPSYTPALTQTYQVVYEVISQEGGLVTYINGQGGIEQLSDAPDDWEKTITAPSRSALSLSCQNKADYGKVWVTIYVNGETVRESECEGAYCIASANYMIP